MVAEVAAKGSLFLVSLWLADVLGTAAFGEFSYQQTVFMFVWMGIDLGLGMYATREVARAPHEVTGFAADFATMRLVLAVGLTLPVLLIMWVSGADALQMWLAAGFTLYVLARAVQLDWLMRGLEYYRALAIINLAIAGLLLAFTYTMVAEPSDAKWASLPWFLSYFAGTLGIQIVLHRKGMRWNRGNLHPSRWIHHWKQSIHFTLSSGVSTLYQSIPLLFVHHVASAHTTGVFAAPFRVVVALVFVASIFPMTIYPVFANLHSRANAAALTRLVGISTVAMAVGAAVVTLFVWTYAGDLMDALFGSQYRAGIPVLKWLSIFFLLRSVRAVFVRGICAAGDERRYSIAAIGSVVVLLVILGMLTHARVDASLAAAAGLAITEAIMTVAMGVLMVASLQSLRRSTESR